MSFSDADQKILLELIAEVQEGSLKKADRDWLCTILKQHEEARALYRRHMDLHAMLHLDYSRKSIEQGMPGTPVAKPASSSVPARFIALASVLMVALILATVGWLHLTTEKTYVILENSQAAIWEGSDLPTAKGSRLGKGTLRLNQGLVTLRFDSGAEIKLEGPAALQIVDAMNCVLLKGTTIADIPESAIGFQIKTPVANVVDYGTRFAVSVSEETGETSTHVFEGLVEVEHSTSGTIVELKTGQGTTATDHSVEDAVDGLNQVQDNRSEDPLSRTDEWILLPTVKDAYTGRVPGHESKVLLYLKEDFHPKEGPTDRKSWLGFDLSGVARDSIAEAELLLHFSPTGWGLASFVPDATFSVYGLEGNPVWDETLAETLPVSNGQAQHLGSFAIPQGVQSGSFGIHSEALARFLRNHPHNQITLKIVRDTVETEEGGLVHGFASHRHPSLPAPTLAIRFNNP